MGWGVGARAHWSLLLHSEEEPERAAGSPGRQSRAELGLDPGWAPLRAGLQRQSGLGSPSRAAHTQLPGRGGGPGSRRHRFGLRVRFTALTRRLNVKYSYYCPPVSIYSSFRVLLFTLVIIAEVLGAGGSPSSRRVVMHPSPPPQSLALNRPRPKPLS